MEQLVEQFRVRTERGEVETLRIYQQIIPAGSFGNPNATIKGMMRVEDEDGNGVNRIDDDSYEIVARGIMATRITEE